MPTKKSKKNFQVVNNKNIDTLPQKKFFSKTKIIIIFFALIFSIVLISLSIVFVLKINFFTLFNEINKGLLSKFGWIWFIFLINYTIMLGVCNVVTIFLRLWKLGIKIPFYQYFILSIAISFLKATTPANFVYDPYTLFWIKMQGVSTTRAASIMFTNTWLWQLVQVIITFPSYVIVSMNFFNSPVSPQEITIFVLMTIGMGIDFIGIIVTTLFCYSKKIHYLISLFFNWIKKKFHLKYRTKAEIIDLYENKAILRQEFLEYLKDWKTTIWSVFFILINELFVYSAMYWSMAFIKPSNAIINFCDVFNVTNVTYTANKFIPLPGGELSIEFMQQTLLEQNGNILQINHEERKAYINNSILIWRSFGVYFPAIIGFGGLAYLIITQIRKILRLKNKK